METVHRIELAGRTILAATCAHPLLSRPDTTGPSERGTGRTWVTARMIYDLAQLCAWGLDALR